MEKVKRVVKRLLPKQFRFSDGLVIFLIIINILPVIAPILQHHGFITPAKVIYFIYSFFCHQIHWRSLHVYDHQCAWCARDMAIWGGFVIAAALVKIYRLNGLRWYQIVPFMVPIALDGGIQTIATAIGVGTGETLYVSTNFMRMVTGAIFGVGLGVTVMPVVTRIEYSYLRQQLTIPRLKLNLPQLAVIPLSLMIIFASYIGFIQLWDATSSSYEPSNFLDSAVKLPEDHGEWLVRRETGLCPVVVPLDNTQKPKDSLALDCFF